jgi:serine/threonine-protein kinase RsbT
MSDNIRIKINQEYDIVTARQEVRKMAQLAGFSGSDLTIIATAVSELARNIISYAKQGEVTLSLLQESGRNGVQIVAQDDGPGILNIKEAMEDGFSTGNSLGLGLPGAKRLMDEFKIESDVGKGTQVTLKKWTSNFR